MQVILFPYLRLRAMVGEKRHEGQLNWWCLSILAGSQLSVGIPMDCICTLTMPLFLSRRDGPIFCSLKVSPSVNCKIPLDSGYHSLSRQLDS